MVPQFEVDLARRREWLEEQIRAQTELVGAAYQARFERAKRHRWEGELRRQIAYYHRDVDRAVRPYVQEYAKLPAPPIFLRPNRGG